MAGGLFLKMRPTWLVTVDGRIPKRGLDVGRIVSRWTNKERNLAILYHVRFWSTILAQGQGDIQMKAGRAKLVFSGLPAQVSVPAGILRDQADIESILDVEAKLMADDEQEMIRKAMEFAAEEDWEDLDAGAAEEDEPAPAK
jgi:hypothetical protein